MSQFDYSSYIADLPERFFLDLRSYTVTFEFLPIALDEEVVQDVYSKAVGATREVLINNPQSDLGNVRINVGGDGDLFSITHGISTYGFILEMSASQIGISIQNESIANVGLASELTLDILTLLFADAGPHSLITTPIYENIFRVTHEFSQTVRVGERLGAGAKHETNMVAVKQILRLEGGSIVDTLQADEVVRADATLSMFKDIGGRRRNIWLLIEAPYNDSQRRINYRFQMRTEFRSAGDLPKLSTETSIALFDFYRDICVRRVLEPTFRDYRIETGWR